VPDIGFPHVDPLIRKHDLNKNVQHRIPLSSRRSIALAHDNLGIVKKPEEIDNYVGDPDEIEAYGYPTGEFQNLFSDHFDNTDLTNWIKKACFYSQEHKYSADNISVIKDAGLTIYVDKHKLNDQHIVTSGRLESKAAVCFGKITATMKPAKSQLLVSTLSFYRKDPWQQIDIGFLGSDTSKLFVNVFFNPGEEGEKRNMGKYGSPVLINLGFDASEKFHTYSIEWEPYEIRWFVDDEMIHVRRHGYPTPVPNLPMKVALEASVDGKSPEKAGEDESSGMVKVSGLTVYKWANNETPDT